MASTRPKVTKVAKNSEALCRPERRREAPKSKDLATGIEPAPFILLHGFAQTPASWDAVAQCLQEAGHRTFVPDLFAWLEAGCTLGDACKRIASIVRQVAGVEGAPVLAGYSMGGRLAAETVVRYGIAPEQLPIPSRGPKESFSPCHPERIAQREGEESADGPLPLAGLVLESAGLGPADEGARTALAERNTAWAARLRSEGVTPFMDWWETLPLFATQCELPEVIRAAIRAEREAHSAEALARSFQLWGAQHQAPEPDTLVTLAQAHAQGLPMLYIAGERDQKYVAVAARAQAAGIPIALIPDAGHNSHLEQPDAFLAHLCK